MTNTAAPTADQVHALAVRRAELEAQCDAARERFRIARAERDHGDTIEGLLHDLRDLLAERDAATSRYLDAATSRYRRARAAQQLDAAPAESSLTYAQVEARRQRRDLANTIARQAEALAAGTFTGLESAQVARLLANVETLRAWTPVV